VVHDVTTRRNTTASLIEKNRLILHAYNNLKNAEQQLIAANNELESRVISRTEQLSAKNQELNYYNEALQKANTDLDNFLYIASHDLKVPLINMEQLLKFLHHDLPDKTDGVSDLLQKLSISVTRMKKTILAISEVAKVQKQVQYQREKIDLAEVCTEITESIAELINSAGAQLEWDFTEVDTVEFSFINLKSILYNLISNAIKYKSPERPPYIRVTSHYSSEYIALRVTDNGLGMDLEKNGGKLFGMFSRLHDHVEGSGIGLYVIKRIIENAGGYIEVKSKEGEGSVFTVYFKNHHAAPPAFK
jgi:signal transduction histidine kinase